MAKKLRSIIDIHIKIKRKILFPVVGIISVLVIAAGFFLYKYLHSGFPNTFPKETKEVTQKTIPADVREKLVKEASNSISLRVPIFMYHYVEYVQDKRDTIRKSLDTLPVTLEAQIKTLQDAGYTFMTAGELADIFDGKKDLPVKSILLTFDDGYRDFYTDVFPILKKTSVRATAYIVPGFLGKINYMDDNQLEEIVRSGLVEIAAHTVHHASLKGASLKIVAEEITQSKLLLEQKFHVPVISFAYPYGAFDSQAIEVVEKAGFRTSASTIPGITQNQANRYFLFRLRPGARTGKFLLDFLSQEKFSPF